MDRGNIEARNRVCDTICSTDQYFLPVGLFADYPSWPVKRKKDWNHNAMTKIHRYDINRIIQVVWIDVKNPQSDDCLGDGIGILLKVAVIDAN
jgi:hypothetical protein